MGLPYMPTLTPQTTPGPQLLGIYGSPMECLGSENQMIPRAVLSPESHLVRQTPSPKQREWKDGPQHWRSIWLWVLAVKNRPTHIKTTYVFSFSWTHDEQLTKEVHLPGRFGDRPKDTRPAIARHAPSIAGQLRRRSWVSMSTTPTCGGSRSGSPGRR